MTKQIFPFFILLHKRAKPILPPWARELKTLTLRPSLNPYSPLKARGFIKPSVLTLTLTSAHVEPLAQ